MTAFSFQVGEPTVSENSLLKPEDIFEADSMVSGEMPEKNEDTTLTAVLESIQSSLECLCDIKAQIKETGTVSRSQAIQALNAAPELELAPIKYYTEAPTAKLGEPTVESISDYIRDATQKLKKWIIQAFEYITKMIERGYSFAKKFLTVVREEKSVDTLNKITWPNEITQEQSDLFLALLDKSELFQSLFNLNSNIKEGSDRRFVYLSDFMSSKPLFMKESLSLVNSKVIKDYINYFKDNKNISTLLTEENNLVSDKLNDDLAKVEDLFISTKSALPSAYRFSSDPKQLIIQLKHYTQKRVKESKDINDSVEAFFSIMDQLRKNKLNPTRILDDIFKLHTFTEDEKEQKIQNIVKNVNSINSFFNKILRLEQEVLRYIATLHAFDKVVINLASSLNFNGFNMETYSIESLSEALNFSLEDSAITTYGKVDQSEELASVSVTEKVAKFFNGIKETIIRLLRNFSMWLDGFLAKAIPRLLTTVTKLQSNDFKENWEKLKKNKTPIPELNKAIKIIAENNPAIFELRVGLGAVRTDMTDGEFNLAKQMLKTRAYLPAIRKSLESLREASALIGKSDNPEDILSSLFEKGDTTGFSAIETVNSVFTKVYQEMEEKNRDKAPFVDYNSQDFLFFGNKLATSFEENKKILSDLSKLAIDMSELVGRGRIKQLLSQIEKSIAVGIEKAVKEGKTDSERMEAYKDFTKKLTDVLRTFKSVVDAILNYVIISYAIIARHNDVAKTADSIIVKMMPNVESIDSFLEFEKEMTVECFAMEQDTSYMSQQGTTAQDQMNAQNATGVETSYATNTSGGSEPPMEDEVGMENTDVDQPFKEDIKVVPVDTTTVSENPESEIPEGTVIPGQLVGAISEDNVIVSSDGQSITVDVALESIDRQVALLSKLKESKGVGRELALEAYEVMPTLLGNPRNFSDSNPDTSVLRSSQEALEGSIQEKAKKVMEWVVEKFKQLYDWLVKSVKNVSDVISALMGDRESVRKNSLVATSDIDIGKVREFISSSEKMTGYKDRFLTMSDNANFSIDGINAYKAKAAKFASYLSDIETVLSKSSSDAVLDLSYLVKQAEDFSMLLYEGPSGDKSEEFVLDQVIKAVRINTREDGLVKHIKELNAISSLIAKQLPDSGILKNSRYIEISENGTIGQLRKIIKYSNNVIYSIEKFVRLIILIDRLAVSYAKHAAESKEQE